jgi:hypothetical protein
VKRFIARAGAVFSFAMLASLLAAPAFAYPIDPGPIVNPVPITLPPNLNYIVNGGFESNAGNPWWLSGSNATIDKVAHRGCLSLRLGGYGNGSAFYRLNLPATASEAKLSFWLQVQSNDPPSADRTTWQSGDHLEFRLQTPGLDYTELVYARDPSVTRNTWSYHYVWDLAPFRGQTVDLSFKAFADATNASWFYIDDVAMLSGLVLMANVAC